MASLYKMFHTSKKGSFSSKINQRQSNLKGKVCIYMLLETIAIIFFILIMIFAAVYSWKLENSEGESQPKNQIQNKETD